jgi:hypothetical protein
MAVAMTSLSEPSTKSKLVPTGWEPFGYACAGNYKSEEVEFRRCAQ